MQLATVVSKKKVKTKKKGNVQSSVNEKTYQGVSLTKSLVLEGLPSETQKQIYKLNEYDRKIKYIFGEKIADEN